MTAIESTETPEGENGSSSFKIPLQPSVEMAYDTLPKEKEISSWDIVYALFEIHDDLAVKSFAFRSDPPKFNLQKKLNEWFSELTNIFDPKLVDKLDWKIAILGLAKLDKELQTYLRKEGIIKNFKEELTEDFDSLLINLKETPLEIEDELVTPEEFIKDNPSILHSDGAAEEDRLGRDPLATALAIWLTRNWNEINKDEKPDNSFIMHLHGAWGSGKTSLLNILDKKLSNGQGFTKKDNKSFENYRYEWNTIWFNAWQHQHIEPGWWPLMDKIYNSSVSSFFRKGQIFKAIKIFLNEQIWRLSTGNQSYFILLLFTLSILLLISTILVNPTQLGISDFETLEDVLKPVIATLGIIGTLWSGTVMVIRSLFWGSTKNADEYLQFTRDPMEKIRHHFFDQMERMEAPLTVIIDDLDRCRANYVVNLLEGIQTMLNNKKLVYIIAADRRWLNNCFELVYDEFSDRITEPGRKMGYLFLEKAFQLSISMPRMTTPIKEQFIDHLYNQKKSETDYNDTKKEAQKALQNKHKDEDIVGTLTDNLQPDIPGYKKQIWQNEAVIQSASQEVEAQTEVFLKEFSHLLEPNPRSLKRLISTYSILRGWALHTDFTILSNEVKRKQFALWTILSLRWPVLAEYLKKDPNWLTKIKNGKIDDGTPENVKSISQNQEVHNVINGQGITVLAEDKEKEIELTVPAIREITGIIKKK